MRREGGRIPEINRCYGFPDVGPCDSGLAKMMVMDACFILEFIHLFTRGSKLNENILCDLFLLENQIPFFVLEDIYECVIDKFEERRIPFVTFIYPLVSYISIFGATIELRSDTNHNHILGYLHYCYQPIGEIKSGFPGSRIYSAVELDMAGVNFKPDYRYGNWAMGMEVKKYTHCSACFFCFSFRPTLRMPMLRIDDYTELVLRNLIAYEQQLHVVNPYVTSYARAMDMLINTHEDIATLVRSEVIVNHIGTNEEASNMINRICKEIVPEHFYYTQQWDQLDSYCKSYFSRKIWKPYFEFKKTYFSSPWSFIALFAGIVLFVLTLIQTIYSVKSS